MKKILFSLTCLTLVFTSCTSETKTDDKSKNAIVKKEVCHYELDKSTTDLKWTAFKTTDKIGVPGTFDKYDITAKDKANSPKELLANTKFAIHGKTVNTGVADRDQKLAEFFFGNVQDDAIMKGVVTKVMEEELLMALTFNGKTLEVPFKYNMSDNVITLTGVLDLNNFNAQTALGALNEACLDLHKAADGISKTWPDVEIAFTATIKEICE